MNAWHPSYGQWLTQRELYRLFTWRLLINYTPLYILQMGHLSFSSKSASSRQYLQKRVSHEEHSIGQNTTPWKIVQVKIDLSSLSYVINYKLPNALWIVRPLRFCFNSKFLKFSSNCFELSLKKRDERSYLSLAIRISILILRNLQAHRYDSGCQAAKHHLHHDPSILNGTLLILTWFSSHYCLASMLSTYTDTRTESSLYQCLAACVWLLLSGLGASHLRSTHQQSHPSSYYLGIWIPLGVGYSCWFTQKVKS